jgi:hypothetical protein
MKRVSDPARFNGGWYVSYESKNRIPNQRSQSRTTETFQSENEAKAFVRAKLADETRINAGTLNPHRPTRIITSTQISGWLDESDS